MEEKRIRRLQIVEILDWLRRLKIPKEEAVFIAGDFNVEFESPEYRRFLADLPLEIDYVKDDAVGGSFSAKVLESEKCSTRSFDIGTDAVVEERRYRGHDLGGGERGCWTHCRGVERLSWVLVHSVQD